MTAIVVALGGKAASTQRGSSLKQFIRTGCRWVDRHYVRTILLNTSQGNFEEEILTLRLIVCLLFPLHCSSAEVIIHLRNRGIEAYRHDMYGDSIVVERQIRADGASHYKIKSVKGNIVSNKKEELINILDHYNIQVWPTHTSPTVTRLTAHFNFSKREVN